MAMLKSARIRNYKSFRDAQFSFGLNNVLVGPNMSGKSNLIDFFKFVQDLVLPTQQGLQGIMSAINPRNGFANVAWKGAEDPIISFELEGTIPRGEEPLGWNYKAEILGNYRWGSAQVHHERLSVKDDEGEHVLIDTKGTSRQVFNMKGKQITESNNPTQLALEIEYPEWEGLLLRQFVWSWKFYDLLPPLMRQPNQMAANSVLNRYGNNFSAWLLFLQARYPDRFERVRSAAKDVFPTVSGLFSDPSIQSTIALSSNEQYLNRPISVAEMSDGELIFLAMLSLLFSPTEIGGALYFCEEPENHLHPRLLSVLVDLLRQVQDELGPGKRSQIFLTTHSPYLVDKFTIDELIILSRNQGSSQPTRPSDKDELKKMITDENVGLGELYYTGALSLA